MTDTKISTIKGRLHFEQDDKLVFLFSEPVVLGNNQSIVMTWTFEENKVCDISAELIEAVDETDKPLEGFRLTDDDGRELTAEMLPLGKLVVTIADDSGISNGIPYERAGGFALRFPAETKGN